MTRRGAGRQRFQSLITEGLTSRTQVTLVCNSLPSFPGIFCFFLWRRYIHAPQKELVGLRDSKDNYGKSQESREPVQTVMDLKVGVLLPTCPKNRGVQSERRREEVRVSKSLETDRQADMENARSVGSYPGREGKLLKREHQALNEREMEIRHILKKQVHLEKRQNYLLQTNNTSLLL